jgi:hypothetical protein
VRNRLRLLERAAHDARAATELSRLGLPHLPWPGSALAPSALVHVLNEIQINRRNFCVEFGSGLSTIYIAKILERSGGRLISFESDSGWAELVRAWLVEFGLTGVAEVVMAPLEVTSSNAAPGAQWYDEGVVSSRLDGCTVDCVLVDGPPAYHAQNRLARYPALPILQSRLAPRCVVFLDDADREGEQEVLRRWASVSDLKFETFLSRGGIARGVRGAAFHAAQ